MNVVGGGGGGFVRVLWSGPVKGKVMKIIYLQKINKFYDMM